MINLPNCIKQKKFVAEYDPSVKTFELNECILCNSFKYQCIVELESVEPKRLSNYGELT